jgi:hypothetical protein
MKKLQIIFAIHWLNQLKLIAVGIGETHESFCKERFWSPYGWQQHLAQRPEQQRNNFEAKNQAIWL